MLLSWSGSLSYGNIRRLLGINLNVDRNKELEGRSGLVTGRRDRHHGLWNNCLRLFAPQKIYPLVKE